MSKEKKKNLRLSYSSIDSFSRCAYLYKLRYVDKIVVDDHGASLNFGIAFDNVTGLMFKELKEENKSNYFKIFEEEWDDIFDNKNVHYITADLDADLFEEGDKELVNKWEQELGLVLADAKKAEGKKKYNYFKDNERKLFYRAAWLSMKRKAWYLIESAKKFVLPKIKEVISIQHKLEGKIGDADYVGYIDLLASIEALTMDGKIVSRPVVLDIKTSARKYADDKIDYSEQLMMYLAGVKEELKTNYAGYIVFIKNIPKNHHCPVCGWKKPKTSKVRNCDKKIKGKRCNTPLVAVPYLPEPQIQIKNIYQEKMDKFVQSTVDWAITISAAITNNSFPRNFKSCKDFGACPYWDLCHGEKDEL